MPARSVVIEKLTKFTGERHEPLTPGEYTQLTGRAGRRGIDSVGYAIVLWSPYVPFDQVAGLAGTRTYALSSSFRPTYNMAANLVRRYPADTAHHLLNLSFAQYRSDAAVVQLESQLDRVQRAIEDAQVKARCELGDAAELRRLVRSTPERQGRSRPSDRLAVQQALSAVRPGDILAVPGARGGGRVAVLTTSMRRGGDVRVRGLTVERKILNLAPRDFPTPPRPVGRIDLPTPYAPSSTSFQKVVAHALQRAKLAPPPAREDGRAEEDRASQAAAHPVAACPDAGTHLRALERVDRMVGEASRLERRIRSRTESLARQFDRVL